jgi:hypothetical protein
VAEASCLGTVSRPCLCSKAGGKQRDRRGVWERESEGDGSALLGAELQRREAEIAIYRIVCWIGTSSCIILWNKHILSDLGFNHPVVSEACGSIAARIRLLL